MAACGEHLNEPLLLSSPIDVIKRMATIWKEPYFHSIYVSAKNIFIGFFTALLAVLLGAISARYRFLKHRLPYLLSIGCAVASFVILALLWFKARGFPYLYPS